MLRRRSRPPVLAELSATRDGGTRPGALGRGELKALADLLKEVGESRAVLVTGNGKSRIALGLAAAAVVEGKRVVLLESDLVEPALARSLGLSAGPGLEEYLRGEAEAGQILQPVALAGPASVRATSPLVCIVAGGPTSANETLLASEGFHHAFEKLRHAYDLVVVDGPPLGGDPGSLKAVADLVDATLVVGDRAQIPKRLPIPVTGLVVRQG